ncbi:MAG: hydantoinase/oxoprolinase family protein, partial [Oscillospiraceae bacterium]
GSTQNVRLALEQLSRFLEKSANVILEEAFGDYCDFLEGVIAEFEDAYGLDRTELSLIGGGGGCAAVVPILAQRLKVPYQQCPNAQIISPIGVAMAMVREVCERTIGSPSQEELLRLREEAISRAVRAGAIRDKIEVVIENEPQKNLVRAIATGVTDRRLLPQDAPRLDRAELLRCIQIQSGYRDDSLLWEGENTDFHLFLFRTKPRSRWDILFGAKREQTLFVMASDGSVKLKKAHSAVRQTQVSRLSADLNAMLDEYSEYGDMGEKLPDVFLVLGKRVLDYSMIREREPLLRLSRFETDPCERQEVLFLVFGL